MVKNMARNERGAGKSKRPVMTIAMVERCIRGAEFFCPLCTEWITQEVHLQGYHHTTFKKDKEQDERIKVSGVIFSNAEEFRNKIMENKRSINSFCDKIDEIARMIEGGLREDDLSGTVYAVGERLHWMQSKAQGRGG